MLDLAILGLLQERDHHGYEIRKRLRDELGLFSNISFGSLYPALSRLEASGAVVTTGGDAGDRPVPIPATGSLSGERAALRTRRTAAGRSTKRSRKTYQITDEGRRRFEALLASEDPGDGDGDRGFSLRLAFARHVAPQARLGLLERRRAELARRLADGRARASSARELDSYTRSVVEHTAESTERDLSWIDQLIESERRSSPRRDDNETVPRVASAPPVAPTLGLRGPADRTGLRGPADRTGLRGPADRTGLRGPADRTDPTPTLKGSLS